MGFRSLLAFWAFPGVVLLAACGGEADLTTSAETNAITSPAQETTIVPGSSTTTADTTTTAPVVTTLGTTTTFAVEIAIEGDDEFIEHTTTALELLEEEAPDSYAQVDAYAETIRWVPAGSGMDVFTRTFLAGEETAYAPGFESDDQIVWFAGTIVHDSCHSRLFAQGEAYKGKDAEVACLIDQLGALQTLDESEYLVDYVRGLIDGADDPDNAYWNDPDRHW